MKDYNVIIPDEATLPETPTLKIITGGKRLGYGARFQRYYHIQATKEEVLALTLKYGKDNIWKR